MTVMMSGPEMTSRRTGGERAPAVAVVNDYPSIITALEDRLHAHSAVRVVDAEPGADEVGTVDVVLFDTFATRRSAVERLRALRSNVGTTPIVVYSADLPAPFLAALDDIGGVVTIPKSVPAGALADLLQALGSGQDVDRVPFGPREVVPSGALGEAEREVLALALEGRTSAQIGHELMRPEDGVASTLARGLRKMGLRERAQLAAAESASSLSSYHCGLRVRQLRREPGQVAIARRFLGERLRDCGADDTSIAVFRLAVSELGANVVEHGRGDVWSLSVYGSMDWWSLEIDGLVAGSSGAFLHPDEWQIAAVPARSGRGLGIVRHLMDEVTVMISGNRTKVICRRRH